MEDSANDRRCMIRHYYIPLSRRYKSNRKLSEKFIRNRLEKEGWIVWRGGFLSCLRREDIYPSIKKKYGPLAEILGERLEELQYLCDVHHGMPDFLCYRKGILKFVECKLGNEQLLPGQKKCIIRLTNRGFSVEVIKAVFDSTKARSALVDIATGDKIIIERQEKLKLRYPKHQLLPTQDSGIKKNIKSASN